MGKLHNFWEKFAESIDNETEDTTDVSSAKIEDTDDSDGMHPFEYIPGGKEGIATMRFISDPSSSKRWSNNKRVRTKKSGKGLEIDSGVDSVIATLLIQLGIGMYRR